MITAELLEIVRCPKALEKAIKDGRDHDREVGRLVWEDDGYYCPDSGENYYPQMNSPIRRDDDDDKIEEFAQSLEERQKLPRRGYVDLMPFEQNFEQQTHYLDHAFEEEIDFQHISLPFLGAAIRNDLLHKMLKPAANEVALEVGCGNGKFCYWNRKAFKTVVGVDAAPLFAEEALDNVPLVRGDGRRLPFAPGSFDKVFSIDVLEHLPAEAIAPFFAEINRVLKPGGQVFIFSNTREMGRLAPIIKLEKRIANYFTKKGVFDFKRDDLRKSDHIKAIRTFKDLEVAIQQGGFRLEQKVFWNGVFQGLVDNIIVKAGEYLVRKAVRSTLAKQLEKRKADQSSVSSRISSATTGLTSNWADGSTAAVRPFDAPEETRTAIEQEAEETLRNTQQNSEIDLAIRKSMKRTVSRGKGGTTLALLRFLTLLMKLDIVLFGKLQTGPFFVVIRKLPG